MAAVNVKRIYLNKELTSLTSIIIHNKHSIMLDVSKLCLKRTYTENTVPITDIKSEIYFILSNISITI